MTDYWQDRLDRARATAHLHVDVPGDLVEEFSLRSSPDREDPRLEREARLPFDA